MTRVRSTSSAAWAEACSRAFVPLNVRTSAERFAATLDHLSLTPKVAVTRVASEGSDVYRSSRIIAAHPRETLLFSVHRNGRGSVTQHGKTAQLSNGSAALYDATKPYTLRFPGRMSEAVLQVPRSALQLSSSTLMDCTARVLPDGAALRALGGMLWSKDLPSNNPATAAALIELLRAAILEGASDAAPSAAPDQLRIAFMDYIDQHLQDPDLDVSALAAHHHVSPRLVHRAFADHGDTPAAVIRQLRLKRAAVDLDRGGSVSRTAAANGFSNVDTFTRAFKRHFGVRPVDVVHRSPGTGSEV
jgi:AraC-like DNA-binding protein